MNITSILKTIDNGVITEETAQAIAEAFNQAVEEKAQAQTTLQVESALLKQDEDHAAKLTSLIEAIDEDHTSKLTKVVEAINEDHASKLTKLSSLYKSTLNKKAEEFSSKIVEELSNYLDLYLEKNLPKQQLEEAVDNVQARKQLEQIKSMLEVDPSTINESVKNVLTEGKTQIDQLHQTLNETYKEKEQLASELQSVKTLLFLEQKTHGMNAAKKEYLTKILSDKTPSYIEENFNYVVEMFEKEALEAKSSLLKEATSKAFTKDAKPNIKLVKESVTKNNEDNNIVSHYLTELGRA